MRGVLATITVLAAGCGVTLPEPAPLDVDPSRGWRGEETPVRIRGNAFYPLVEFGTSAADEIGVNAGFSAFLVDDTGARTTLGVTELLDYETLNATIPSGLETGGYDLLIVGPTGRQGTLPDAFTVTETRADALSVDSQSLTYQVFETAEVDIQVLDTSGDPLFLDVPVTVTAVTTQGDPVAGSFLDSGLVDQTSLTLPDGLGILGRLAPDGSARVSLRVTEPQAILVTVSPAEPDAPMNSETLRLEWEPGADLGVRISFPGALGPPTVTAGEDLDVFVELVDEFGNRVNEPDAPVNVWLQDSCFDWNEILEEFSGSELVTARLTSATGTASCDRHRIVPVGVAQSPSDEIIVVAGEADRFDVEVSSSETVAGEGLLVAVRAVDAYGNPTAWTGSVDDITISDSAGGIASWDCEDGDVFVACTVVPQVAGQIALTVTDGQLVGSSASFVVRPSDASTAQVQVLSTGPVIAGLPVRLAVELRDAFDNRVTTEDVAFAFSDPSDEVNCTLVERTEEAATVDCDFFTARDDAYLGVSAPSLGVSGQSESFVVVNGDIATVDVTTVTTTVVAGDDVAVNLAAFDAFGNPYVVQSVSSLTITDGVGPGATITLDSAGLAAGALQLTQAGTVTLEVGVGGTPYGSSDPITVVAGPASGIAVTLADPWVWVGTATEVRVLTRDLYGNAANFSGTVGLTTSSGLGTEVSIELSAGRGTGLVTWSDVDLADAVVASTDGGLSGVSPSVAVLESCGGSGPTLVVDEGSDLLVCHTGSSANVTASLSGSSAATGTLDLYGLSLRTGTDIGTSASPSVLVQEVGRYDGRLVVAQTDGCAVEESITAWVGSDDGSPVGPIEVALSESTLDVGTGTANITISDVTDCSGDAASSETLRLRTDRGAVTGASPTGQGLEITLDSSGSGTAVLDMTGVATGGEVILRAYSEQGAAQGEATLEAVGDDARPEVWWMTPAGDALTTVDEVTLRFSEPLLESTVTTGAFGISGPGAASVDAVALVGDDDEVTLSVSSLDASLGTWVVTASDTLRDAAGNRLSGDWSGASADFVGVFGDLPTAAPAVTRCEPASEAFRPDGDDGAGAEADSVALTVEAGSRPDRWMMTVADEDGAVLVVSVQSATAATETLTWNGLDAAERVVENGTYTLAIEAVDTDDNRSAACEASVQVANRP